MAAEQNGSGVNWSKVRFATANGSIDLSATLAELEIEARAYLDGIKVDTTAIAQAVSAVFNRMPAADNKFMEIEELALQALANMPDDPNSSSKVLKDIKNYLRAESDRFVATNGAEGQVWVKVGRNGGVWLSTPATVQRFCELQAKKAGAIQV